MNVELVLVAIKAVTVLAGAGFLWITFKAWRANRRAALAILMAAVALLIVSAIAEGSAYQGFHLSLDQAHVIEAVFTLAAFVVLLASVLANRPGKRMPAAEPKVRADIDEAERP